LMLITPPVYLFEVSIDALTEKRVPVSTALSRFPEVRRDIAVIVDQEVPAVAVTRCIRSASDETLTNLKLFDVYLGKGIDPNRKSIALGLTFQHPSRTLTDDEVGRSIDTIIVALAETMGASLRN